jgi:hypothetical protein
LLENGLLSAETLAVSVDSRKGVLLTNELCLIGYPLLLDLSDIILHLVDFLLDVVFLGFEGSCILILTVLLLELV